MKKTIVIDGRMWGADFTGIGHYLAEVGSRLFVLFEKENFVLFVPQKIADTTRFPKNVHLVIAEEKIYSTGEQIQFWRKLEKEKKADLFWFPHFNVPLFFSRPFITTIHDLTILRFPGKKMKRIWHRLAYSAVLRHALKKSKAIITVSQNSKKQVLDFCPHLSPEKITPIWNGVNKARFAKDNEKKKSAFQKKWGNTFFVITGVWREHKNITGAIAGFNLFRQHGGKGKLVITGREDSHYNEIKETALKSPFFKDIIFSGFLPNDDMPALFSAASALIFPSFSEGFGLPLLEAMAANTPVLCSNIPIFLEVGGEAALFFDPKNPEDIAIKMVDILRKTTRRALQEKGKKQIDFFDWDESAKKTAEVFQKIWRQQ